MKTILKSDAFMLLVVYELAFLLLKLGGRFNDVSWWLMLFVPVGIFLGFSVLAILVALVISFIKTESIK